MSLGLKNIESEWLKTNGMCTMPQKFNRQMKGNNKKGDA
jgi:hypothetical protein